tara:strand:- start:1984 stop:2310 length:327 start_codon:yes stop_codon:yes gene_type:complete
MFYLEKNLIPYLIYARDFENRDEAREHIREAHRDHLRSIGDKLLTAGALLDDDGNVMGGISLIDTDDQAEAERFAYNDPYAKAGIRKETQVLRWRKRWWEGEFLLTDL